MKVLFLSNRRILVAIFLIVLIPNFACTMTDNLMDGDMPDRNIPLDPSGGSSGSDDAGSNGSTSTEGLSILLSEGEAIPVDYQLATNVDGIPLSEEEISAILDRLPAFAGSDTEQEDFHLPEDVLPPPKTGEIIEEQFPPAEGIPIQETAEDGPLEVIRFAPEGEIPIAPFINITFNQAMVPITTIQDLETIPVPVQISPEIPGKWRWIGTKTISFQHDAAKLDRLPMATEYVVTIPAGTKSITGNELVEMVEFSFATPPPTLQMNYPNYSPQPTEPIFFASFDQLIDQGAVLKTIEVTADGKAIPIRLSTEAEIQADKTVTGLIKNSVESRWISFKTKEPLPKDSEILVKIGPGTPSAEGPRTTTTAQEFSFQTYAPLKVSDYGCSWAREECRPLVPFFIEFNNPIDSNTYDETMLQIDPELPGASVNIIGNTLQIRGMSKGQTTYRVTISGELKDIFGQTLGRDETLRFKVGSATPILVGPDDILLTLDPISVSHILSLYSINYSKLNLSIYKVQPSDWPEFKEYLREYQRTDKQIIPPGELVRDETMTIEGAADSLSEVKINLDEEMEGDFGHFIVIAKPPRGLFQEDRYWEAVQVWVQITQIGIDAFVDHSEMVAWVNELSNGSPISDITLQSDSGKTLGTTDENGIIRFSIPSEGIGYLLANRGEDFAFLPPTTYYWGDEGWSSRPVNDELRWYVFDDRQMYRPGEEVHLKGWIRQVGMKQEGDVGLVSTNLTGIYYQVFDPQGNELLADRIDVNSFGGFDLYFTIPENSNLGFARIEMNSEGAVGNLEGRWYSHGFQIQEFRRPEFEVQARNETTGPYFSGDTATVAVEAKYYAGGPLPNAEVNWVVSSNPTNYSPPNWPDFTFGIWEPWWWYFSGGVEGSSVESFSGKTDATGNHYLDLEFSELVGMRPYSILAETTVMDINRQAWSARTSLLVHPGEYYVGLHSDQYFVEKGTPLEIDLIATDLDGNPVTDRQIEVKAARMEWKFEGGSWQEKEADIQECLVGSKIEPVQCTFDTPIGGRYQITAIVTDNQGRQNRSQFTRWVSGGEQPPSREVEKEEVSLIPDKESYQPGDIARILVQAPFSPAEGLLTVSRSGILYTSRFQIENSSTTLEVPIESAHIPNLQIQIDLVGSSQRVDDQGDVLSDAPARPAYASGTLNLDIPPLSRTLSLEVIPQDTRLEPGGETSLNLKAQDQDGKPVSDAEIAVVVVDEAILALTNYQLIDPVSVFYRTRPSDLNSYYSRSTIILADPEALVDAAESTEYKLQSTMIVEEAGADMMYEMEAPAAEEAAPRAMGGGEQAEMPAIQVRTDFNPLAEFAPEVRTDSNGFAKVDIKLPDNLTRYRVMAVVVDSTGKKFGTGESNITARLPLMVRPSAPRFLNFGDTFEMPIVVQNQTDQGMEVDVVFQVANLELVGDQGIRIEVPANDRVEVRFPTKTDMAGTARFQVAAVSGTYGDAAEGQLPVYTPATTEAFATHGTVDDGAVIQPIGSPVDVFQQFGGLEIQTSSTAVQALTDAVIYLVTYPYECSEQLASRILGIAALRDVLSAFEAEGLPSPGVLEERVRKDIDQLQGLQNWDGGFPYWRRGQDSIPFNTIHVAHALQRARLKGFEVPEDLQYSLLGYLQNIESQYPYWYSTRTKQTLSAYALYVRHLLGDSDPQKSRRLFNEAGLEELTPDAIGWIWQVLSDDTSSADEVDAIKRYLNNHVVETAGAANFITSFDDQNYLLLGSNRRTDAILLDGLINDDPQSDLIPKVVNGLLAHRVRGRWNNTQENVFVLLALDRYFNTFESQTPDFVARIWLGNTYAGEHSYSGRTTEQHETEIPMLYLVDPEFGGGETQNLLISKDGVGRLYYRIGLKYAPTDLWLEPLDMGFVVQRVYEAVDDPEDVTLDDEGIWHIKAGARVRVKLTMVADNRRYHVALIDPLPAGLEIVNPALAVSESIPDDQNTEESRYFWWWSTWYNHQNMRDERAEAFTHLLWDGVYEYTYIARATTPGTFIVPPAKAEEMYSPEVFGRSASDKVIIE